MADIARPALAEVLAALADSTRDRTPVDLDYVRRALVPPRVTIKNGKVYAPAESGVSGWYMRHDSPAEAVEALATAGLWPWEIGDAMAPRWWCEACKGTGKAQEPGPHRGRVCLCCGVPADELAETPRGIGHTADPPSHAALVAVASLGAPLLRRITHTLVREIARAAGCPDARVVWRVMGREAIVEWAERASNSPRMTSDEMLTQYVVAHEIMGRDDGVYRYGDDNSPWPERFPWLGVPGVALVRRAWPALRTLAVGDGETPQPTGVHLVGLDASRIVLAVEAIGGDR